MNITIKEKSGIKAIFEVVITPEDYKPGVEKALKQIKNNGNFQGFRKGKVPMAMVQKLYGMSAKVEEVQRQISEGVDKALRENELKVLGQPMVTDSTPAIDFEKQETFALDFEVALRPEVTNLPTKEDKLPYYNIELTDADIDARIQEILKSNPRYVDAEVVEVNDIIRGTVCELDADGKPLEGGLRKEESAMLLVSMIKNEEQQKLFIGSSLNSVIVFDPTVAFGSTVEFASLLGLKKEEVEGNQSKFSFEIQKITRSEAAELNQDFFDALFGEGEVKSEDEMRAKLKEIYGRQNENDSMYKFQLDTESYIKEHKANAIALDEELLKKWYKTTEQGAKMTDEEFEKSMPRFFEDIKGYIYRDAILTANNIVATEEDTLNSAKQMAAMQFAQYGMNNIPEDVLANYAKTLIEKPESRNQINDQIERSKFAAWMKDQVTLEEKNVTAEEFKKMFEPAEA